MASGSTQPIEIARAVGALSDGVVLTDPSLPDHPIVWANDAFMELTGYRRDEVVGRNCASCKARRPTAAPSTGSEPQSGRRSTSTRPC